MYKDILFNKNEIEYYTYLFETYKKPFSNYIDGREVAGLFMKSNLNKRIWDFSAFRKEKEMNIQEFQLACRCVKICQQGRAINEINLISLNNDTRLPEFDGVIFNPKTKNDDDEFIEIEEKYDADNITTYNKIKRSNYNSSDIQNNDKPDKKKIEDLFDLLDDKPKSFEVNNISSKQPVNDLYSNINMNTNHNNEQHKIGSQILNRMEVNVNNANQSLNFNTLNQPVTYEEDDEFVEIEENNHVYTPTDIRQTENISYYVDNNMTTLNSIGNAENIDKGNLNNIKFNLDSNLSIANNESCVHEEKQVDFQKILLDSNFQPQKKKEDEFINDKNILTASNNFNSEENIKTYEMISNSNKKTLDDLLNTVDIDWNANNNKNIENLDKKDQIQDNFLTITFNTPVESNTENFVDKNNNQAGKDNQDKIDDKIYNINNFIINNTNINEKQQYDNEEFCEVEENTEDHDPNEKQHTANDNLLFELDFINQTGKKNGIAPPLDEDIQHIAEDKPNMTTQHNKVSIINYTQDDFLNEFKKEQHLENKNDNDANDDFEFTSVEENNDTSEHIKENLSEIEYVFKYKIKNSSFFNLFKSNSSKVVQALIEMMSQIEHNSKDILEFVNTNKFNKFKFEHNRKLDYFFKSIQQILVISCKMFSLLNDDDITKRNLENKINKLIILIQDYRKVKQECFDLNKFFDDTILNKFSKLTDLIYKVDKEKLVDKKLCYLCLYDNEFTTESITNIFSYDFHTSCINLWLNKINNKSPYDYL